MTNDIVTTTFEACAGFASADGSAVCDWCGWLDTEHLPVLAIVTPSASSRPSSPSSQAA